MEQQIMYIVKNDAGEYLTTWPDVYNSEEWHSVLTECAIYGLPQAKVLRDVHGGQIYTVQLTISDTPVSF